MNSLESVMDFSTSDLTSFPAFLSDTDLFTISADDTAVPGSYSITVAAISLVHKLASKEAGAFSGGEFVGEGIIHFKVGSDRFQNQLFPGVGVG